METLTPRAVDSVEIQILVDNVTDSLSTVPAFVEIEFAGLGRRRRGDWVLAGSCLCCACLIAPLFSSNNASSLEPSAVKAQKYVCNLGALAGGLPALPMALGVPPSGLHSGAAAGACGSPLYQ